MFCNNPFIINITFLDIETAAASKIQELNELPHLRNQVIDRFSSLLEILHKKNVYI